MFNVKQFTPKRRGGGLSGLRLFFESRKVNFTLRSSGGRNQFVDKLIISRSQKCLAFLFGFEFIPKVLAGPFDLFDCWT